MVTKSDKPNFYFDSLTERAILDFVESDDEEEKNAIYREYIKPGFESLVDGLIFSYKFKSLYGYSDLKNDCVTFLYESMEKFDPNKGSKAFSYFNVIAKHYLIGKSVDYNKKVKKEVRYIDESTKEEEISKDRAEQDIGVSPEEDVIKKEFFYVILHELDNWKYKYFKKETEVQVIDAVSALMKNVDKINIHNKKAVYMYLKEMTGLNSKQLMVNLNKLRRRYRFTKKIYNDQLFFGVQLNRPFLSGSERD